MHGKIQLALKEWKRDEMRMVSGQKRIQNWESHGFPLKGKRVGRDKMPEDLSAWVDR